MNKPFHVRWNGGADAPKIGHLARVAALRKSYRIDDRLFVEVHRVGDKHHLKRHGAARVRGELLDLGLVLTSGLGGLAGLFVACGKALGKFLLFAGADFLLAGADLQLGLALVELGLGLLAFGVDAFEPLQLGLHLADQVEHFGVGRCAVIGGLRLRVVAALCIHGRGISPRPAVPTTRDTGARVWLSAEGWAD